MRTHRKLAKDILTELRAKQMSLEMRTLGKGFSRKIPKIFNLDLHISVTKDIKSGLKPFGTKYINWSISGANSHSRKIFKIEDPVRIVNGATWLSLNEEMIEDFSTYYRKFLSKFDGFVCCYPPAFTELFRNFKKPNLVISPIRYEAPYTNRKLDWERLNNHIKVEQQASRLLLSSNNAGDMDYLEFHLGQTPNYTASVCEYTGFTWNPQAEKNVFLCRSLELQNEIEKVTQGKWIPLRKLLGNNFSWKDFNKIREVLIIPYTISTMTFFELATAGVPVAVPSKRFIKELIINYDGILNELSYFQLLNLKTESMSDNDPNNFRSKYFLDWWLDRADFYNVSLMPNVRIINSFDELNSPRNLSTANQVQEYFNLILTRNSDVKIERAKLLEQFYEML